MGRLDVCVRVCLDRVVGVGRAVHAEHVHREPVVFGEDSHGLVRREDSHGCGEARNERLSRASWRQRRLLPSGHERPRPPPGCVEQPGPAAVRTRRPG